MILGERTNDSVLNVLNSVYIFQQKQFIVLFFFSFDKDMNFWFWRLMGVIGDSIECC